MAVALDVGGKLPVYLDGLSITFRLNPGVGVRHDVIGDVDEGLQRLALCAAQGVEHRWHGLRLDSRVLW